MPKIISPETNNKPIGRPWIIEPEDVRLYMEAMWAVSKSHEWPWTEKGRPNLLRVPDRDDELPRPDQVKHWLVSYFNTEAQQLVKARVRKLRYRLRKKTITIDLDEDAWQLVSTYAQAENISLSEAIKAKFRL